MTAVSTLNDELYLLEGIEQPPVFIFPGDRS